MATIAVVGLGLMGASFAMAVKKAQPDLTIVGFDTDAGTVHKAMVRDITSVADSDLGVVDMADVVVVAVPILAMREVFTSLGPHVEGKVVTDVASTKAKVLYTEGLSYMDVLLAKGLVTKDQADSSFDGTPSRFVAAKGKAIQQGYASNEPYRWEHDVTSWKKPVK